MRVCGEVWHPNKTLPTTIARNIWASRMSLLCLGGFLMSLLLYGLPKGYPAFLSKRLGI